MKKEIFNKKVIPMFAFSLIIATIGVFIGFFVPPVLFLPIMIAEFIVLIATFFLRKKKGIGFVLLFLFTFLTGITTAPIVAYAGLVGGIELVLQALGLTTVTFGGLAAYVYFTNKDFRSIGTFLTFALFGVILASLVNIFLHNDMFSLIVSVVTLLIFLGFTMFDMSKIIRDYDDDEISAATLTLYLDFLNIFIQILQLLIFSKRRND